MFTDWTIALNFSVFFIGMMTGLGLIVAIGAQNAFVLRQGLRGEHVFAVCLTCAASDAFLILLGVTSFSQISEWLPWLAPVMRYAGSAFLIWYGLRSMKAALSSTDALLINPDHKSRRLRETLVACLAITWLNPHVYLDTVVLLGTISTQFGADAGFFAAGAMSASFVFFFTLGYGSARLRPFFAKPKAWRILEAVIAFVMWAIAARLLLGS